MSQKQEQLAAVCAELRQKGLPLSVALVRSRAPFPVSITEAIETIKRVKNGSTTPAPVPEKSASLSRVDALEQRIETLEARLAQLEQQLAKQ
ncbi:hypothetical protein [Alteromonas sp. CYL-A6]|uniref:hypothetical protein n=1 Tax=Alteromonas nitratireducens TaxID=3390813 RepID=UPI0034B8574E